MLINDLAVTGSFTVNGLPVQLTMTGSLATTGSNSFTGSQSISGSLTTTGTITAQRLIVNVVSSSIVYSSGSNIFGNSLSNTQQLTGSVSITGSLTYNGASITTIGNVTAAAATGAGQVAFFNGSNVITSVSGLYFDGVDKLGVGTTNPLTRIEVYNSSEDRHFSAIGASPSLNLYSTNTSPVYGGTFGLATLTNAYIQGAAAGDLVIVNRGSTSGSILFGIGAYSGNEKMRLSTSGNLGLGTASPAAKLHVVGSESRFGGVASGFISVYNATGRSGYIQANGGTDLRIGSDTDPMTFYVGGSEQMRLTSTGLGIGTTSPATKVDISYADNAYAAGLTVTNTTNNTQAQSKINIVNSAGTVLSLMSQSPSVNGGAAFVTTSNTTPLVFGVNYLEKMRLDTSGNLGLGVVPSAWGDLYGAAIQVRGGSLLGFSTSVFDISQNAYADNSTYRYVVNGAASQYRQESGVHKWYNVGSGTAGASITFTQAMTLDASGRLGIGTTSPSHPLHVVTSGTSTTPFSNVIATFRSQASGRSQSLQFSDGTNQSYIDMISGALLFGTGGDNERLRITSGGDVGIGCTPAYSKLQIRGSDTGNTYPSTASININNYESAAFGRTSGINFSVGNGSSAELMAGVYGVYTSYNTSTGGALAFITNNGSGSFAEKMRITSVGNVGIGTTTPGSKLSIVGLPTSSAGLSSGDIWNDGGTLKIV